IMLSCSIMDRRLGHGQTGDGDALRCTLRLALSTRRTRVMVTLERTEQGVSELMLVAANDLLAALARDQRERLLLPFDEVERLNWHFTPVVRRGLPLKDMTPWQQAL